jgi:NAD(P)-dependent dehydrogenase (short-subunit alcohol dehydrogenase family)
VVAKRGERQVAAYSASKHGVLGLVRAAADEVARTGVTVNAVCPGYVDTPMTDATVAAMSGRMDIGVPEARALLARRQPIGRLVDPDEVAAAVLACVDNAAITGQGINVDGGTVQS